ncbi:hypothetical protein [Gabonibacter chumensis]|nr:hypothetical protein [Gabonibacter chumensis]MCR9012098.1 hypothetical protein [Gabonibacter chumensis]
MTKYNDNRQSMITNRSIWNQNDSMINGLGFPPADFAGMESAPPI